MLCKCPMAVTVCLQHARQNPLCNAHCGPDPELVGPGSIPDLFVHRLRGHGMFYKCPVPCMFQVSVCYNPGNPLTHPVPGPVASPSSRMKDGACDVIVCYTAAGINPSPTPLCSV